MLTAQISVMLKRCLVKAAGDNIEFGNKTKNGGNLNGTGANQHGGHDVHAYVYAQHASPCGLFPDHSGCG